jgi:hypothetical protein
MTWIGSGLPTREEWEEQRCEFTEMVLEMSPETPPEMAQEMREMAEWNRRNRRWKISHGEIRFSPRFQGDMPETP